MNTSVPSKEKLKIYPVFLPNLGCKIRCVYCNQYIMTGEDIPNLSILGEQLADLYDVDEIAFYGGTFTGLKAEIMTALLSLRPDIPKRISTRPDEIDEKIIELLLSFNVKTVELGVESLDEEVLLHSKRNYKAEDVLQAIRLLKENFQIIAHLMVGLPYDSEKKSIESTRILIDEGIKLFRIHPVIVFKNTELYLLYKEGLYTPLSLDEALSICAKQTMLIEAHDGKVIRIGYHVPQSQMDYVAAGPYHPSFGDMVRSYIVKEVVKSLHIRRIEYNSRFKSWITAYENNKLPVETLETERQGIFFDGVDYKGALKMYLAQKQII